jgi:large subunit ribosomal protein L24
MKRIKKNDLVIVITGKDKGKTGRVLRLLEDDRVVVERVNRVKRHRKPAKDFPGGIEEKEGAIHLSNVMLVDPKSKKRTRIRFSGRGVEKYRVATKSSQTIG